MGRLVINRLKPSDVAWYRFARTRFHCPHCNVELRPFTRASGYFLQALIIVLALGSFLLFTGAEGRRPWLLALAVGSVISLIAVLGLVCAQWGFGYSIASGRSGQSDAPKH
jgi:hypothetical protein